MKKRYLAILIAVALFAGSAVSTYAFWTFNVQNKDNTIETATLGVKVNGADRFGTAGTKITLDNLHPSNVYTDTEKIVVENTGTIALNYKLTFSSQSADTTIFDNVLVQLPGDDTWYHMKDLQYVSTLGSGRTHNINAKFRLDPSFSDLNYMGKTFKFSIDLVAVQYEQSLMAVNKTTADLTTDYGALRLKDFSDIERGSDNVYLSDKNTNLGDRNARQSIKICYSDTQKITFKYDAQNGKVTFQKGNQTLEYTTEVNADFDSIHFLLVDGGENTTVQLDNITINGNPIDQTLTGDANKPKWIITGDLQDENGGFTLTADLLLSGDHPRGEHSKVGITFGK